MNTNRRRASQRSSPQACCGAPPSRCPSWPCSGCRRAGWPFVRFGLAAAILLAASPRRAVRAACTPLVLASGAVGYGGSVVVQNAGITRTSVTHAALLIGATPVLVAIIAALWHRTVARPVAWAGFAVSLAGVGLITGGQGGGATSRGDGLVLAVAAAVGRVHRGPGPPAARPRPGGPHRRAVPGRGPGHAAVLRGHRGHPGRPARPGRGPGHRRPWWPRARCCRSPCSPTGRPGSRPRWPAPS